MRRYGYVTMRKVSRRRILFVVELCSKWHQKIKEASFNLSLSPYLNLFMTNSPTYIDKRLEQGEKFMKQVPAVFAGARKLIDEKS
jgi:hypothetical protein